MFIDIIKIVTIFLGSFMFLKNGMNYIKGKNKNIAFFIQAAFYFFYYIPLICDLFLGRPDYPKVYYAFAISYKDVKTEIIYCSIITYINYMFYRFQIKNIFTSEKQKFSLNSKILSYIIFMCIVFLLVYIIKNCDDTIINAIFSYNMRFVTSKIAYTLKSYAFILIILSLLILVLENDNKLVKIKIFLLSPIFIFACLLNGKRTSLFLCVIGILIVLFLKNIINGKKNFFCIILISSILLGTYASNYTQNVTQDDNQYLSYRINFCRDDTLKTTIYSELNNEKILEYRGQTFLYYLTFYIQRDNWQQKPYPYATYFTSYLTNIGSVKNLGWNMTTSIYDEMLSNMGWIGIIIIPFIMNKVLKEIQKRKEGILGKGILLLGLIDVLLLIAVQASAFLIAYIALLILIIAYDVIHKIKVKD